MTYDDRSPEHFAVHPSTTDPSDLRDVDYPVRRRSHTGGPVPGVMSVDDEPGPDDLRKP